MKLTLDIMQIYAMFMSGLLAGALYHYYRVGIQKRKAELEAIKERRKEERDYYARARELLEDHYRRANGREPWQD